MCSENYSEDKKQQIVTQNRRAIKAANIKNIEATAPNFFMPYVGFFEEKAGRGHYIRGRNTKNTIDTCKPACERNGCELLNRNDNKFFRFYGSILYEKDKKHKNAIGDYSVDAYLSRMVVAGEEELNHTVISCFLNSGYKANLVQNLVCTCDRFEREYNRFLLIFLQTLRRFSMKLATSWKPVAAP